MSDLKEALKESQPSMTYNPFAGKLMHSAFTNPDKQNSGQWQKNRATHTQPISHTKKETTNMATTQHETIKHAADEGHSVHQQRRHAAEQEPERHPSSVSDATINAMIRQSGEILQQMVTQSKMLQDSLISSQAVNNVLLERIGMQLEKQNESGAGEFYERINKEFKKKKNKESSLFSKTRWEKAEDMAWTAGGVAAGVAVGYGVYTLAANGMKALLQA